MRRKTKWRITAAAIGLLVLLAILIVVTLQSSWFYNEVRALLVTTIEDATGGRVDIGSFHFDWKRLRAEVTDLTLHGTEPAGKPPLLHIEKAALTLKIISLWKRYINLQSLEVASPTVYLIVAPNGTTNLPKPRVQSNADTMQTLLRLAIGHFDLSHGIFTVEGQGSRPFEAHGENFSASVNYDGATPRYLGQIVVDPLQTQIPDFARTAWSVKLAFSAERNRIGVESAHIATQGITIEAAGAVEDLAQPHVSAKYTLRAEAAAAQRLLRVKLVDRGSVDLSGNATWINNANYAITGALHVYDAALRSGVTRVANARADGDLIWTPKQRELRGVRYSGQADGITVQGRIETAALRGNDLDLRGLGAAALGGTFQGDARVRNFERFIAKGVIAGLDSRRAVAVYSREPLPWDAVVSGPVELDASLKNKSDLKASAALTVSPAGNGPPVRGHIAGSYDARAGTLDLGNSSLELPNSRVDFSGVLGRELRVHLETRDPNDFLPVFGTNAGTIPVKVQNGQVVFNGTASGKLDEVHATGHITATHAVYNDESVDSLTADVSASPTGVEVRNATAIRGPLRAEFQFSGALRDWKPDPGGAISGAGALKNATIADVAAALKLPSLPAAGALNVTGQLSGSFGNPQASADIAASKGTIKDEPFDRFVARLAYSGRTLNLTGGELDAGPKRVTITASYEHALDRFDAGHLQFRIASNVMAIHQIRMVEQQSPGAQGTLEFRANGALDLGPSTGGRLGYRIEDLHANVAALGLRMGQQPFGDVRLTANSQGGEVRAHLESNFADSTILGDGQWRLTGDYPGSATINFSKLDFVKLRSWLSPSAQTPDLIGEAEGSLRIQGDALKPATLTAELNIPKFQIAPAKNVTSGVPFTLANASPIIARLTNSTVTVESAHLRARSTDISITGKASLEPKLALDLRAQGQIDLAVLHDFDKNFFASGSLAADTTIRGNLSSPQVSGRVQFRGATFNLADFPNGISNASGAIVFSGSRATIQDFSGETGGGTIQLTGFATYEKGEMVFRIHARAEQVRVRKPEGVSSVSDADLTLSGTTRRSLLSGTVTIRRVAFNPETDFSSLIASSAQPVAMPSAQTGLLGGLGFDVQISSAPDIQVQSTLTQDVQLEANLRLRGTATNPAMLGRINITQGQLTFFGTKYQVSDGSISFYNPVRIAPVLDISLTTKVQGVEITLSIAGPIDHLTLTPSSDSSLNYSDIINLLVTGRPPTSDPALLSGQNALGPGAFQQLGASALLGQAIAAPVTGRLQRFFGVSSLRIDPTIPGIDVNPAARLTMQQQVTPSVTFTYITSVTTTNPQIVQVEWALNSKWSIAALREENGQTGLDIYFKKKF